jgi:hypothetical protein
MVSYASNGRFWFHFTLKQSTGTGNQQAGEKITARTYAGEMPSLHRRV